MIRFYWPAAKLQPILDYAEANGEHRIQFKTVSDAERFRFACYNLRRRTNNHHTRLIFELNPNDCSILIKRAPEAEIQLEPSP